MNKQKIALQIVALIVAYGLACSDLRELLRRPTRSPAQTVSARADSNVQRVRVGGLSVEQVASVIHAVAPSLRNNCWQPRIRDRTATPRVALRLAIAPDGDVRRLEIERAPARFADLAPCVAAGLAALRFAEGSIGSDVTLALTFSDAELPQVSLGCVAVPPP